MDELNKIAPETSKIKKDLPFNVPTHYFDDFSARLHHRLQAEQDFRSHKKPGIIRYLKPALGLAASFILVFLLVYWPIKSFLPQYIASTQTIIQHETEEDHYFPSFENIDENSFFALILETFNGADVPKQELNEEELLNYLSANISDYEIYLHTEN